MWPKVAVGRRFSLGKREAHGRKDMSQAEVGRSAGRREAQLMLNSPTGFTTPAAKGEPLTGLNEPSAPTEKTEILEEPWLATNRNLPLESAVMKLGLAPTA